MVNWAPVSISDFILTPSMQTSVSRVEPMADVQASEAETVLALLLKVALVLTLIASQPTTAPFPACLSPNLLLSHLQHLWKMQIILVLPDVSMSPDVLGSLSIYDQSPYADGNDEQTRGLCEYFHHALHLIL